MSQLADLLRDQGFQSDIGDGFKSLLQGASNSVASGVSAPVDGLAWLLKQAGVNTGTPVGGSDWMAQQGLTAEPKNKLAGLIGEGLGNATPFVAAAKAPQLARGLLNMGENMAAPVTANKQLGAIIHSPEQMAAWAKEKEAKRWSDIYARDAERNAEKQLAESSVEKYKMQGMGPAFNENQLEAIKNYRLSGDRFGAIAEGRAQTVNTLKNELEKLGYPIEKVSQQGGGNSVYANINGQRVRISDHSLPMTPERMTNRDRGLTGNWDREVLTDNWQGRGLKDFLSEILGKSN